MVRKMKTIYYLYISILFFFLFFFMSIFVINGSTFGFDMPMFIWIRSFSVLPFFKGITYLGSTYIIVLLLIFFCLIVKNKSDKKFMISMMIFEVCTNMGLKLFFGRMRPNVPTFIEETGFSFPSGHIMASTMFYGLCIYFLWHSHLTKLVKILGTVCLTLLIILVGLSRIYLGVHYASDILGGFFLSFCMLTFGIFFYETMQNSCQKRVKYHQNL